MELHRLRLERKEVYIAGLPKALDGLRLLHATDLHLRGNEAYDSKLLGLVKEADPDLIALTGDYLASTAELPVLREVAGGLSSCRPVYAVLGDNDLEDPAVMAQIEQVLELARVRVLRNRGEAVQVRHGSLLIAGIDDPRFPCSDLREALRGRAAAQPVVLLSHSAEVFPQAGAAGVDLLLAGHTHGGQVCLPMWGALYTNDRLGRRFASGLLRHGRLQMHVGRGVGWAKLPIRLFCPPEITLLTLRHA